MLAFEQWLSTWDPVASTDKLVQTATADIDQLTRCYAHLVVAFICSSEPRNLFSLQRAEYEATQVIRSLDSARGPLNIRVKVDGLHLQPWAAYWFRATARTSLGRKAKALLDWQRAYSYACPQKMPGAGQLTQEVQDDLSITLLSYTSNPLIAKFLHDLANYLVDVGDWGWDPEKRIKTYAGNGAKQFFEASQKVGQDVGYSSPYLLADYASFLSFARDEAAALQILAEAHERVEQMRAGREFSASGYCASGRVYFQVGLLAYKFRHRHALLIESRAPFGGPQRERLEAFEKGVADLPAGEFKNCFEDDYTGPLLLAHSAYMATRNPFRAIPCLILLADPLAARGEESCGIGARHLLWDLIYAMGTNFASGLTNYENLVGQYFASDLIAGSREELLERSKVV